MKKCPYAEREIEDRCSTMSTWNDLDLTNLQLVNFSSKYCWNSDGDYEACPVYLERTELESKVKELSTRLENLEK